MSDVQIVKRRTVLYWFETHNTSWQVRGDGTTRLPHTGEQWFVTEEGQPNADVPGPLLRLDYDVWQALGGPTTITVTVEPGDLLNEGGDQ